MAPVYIIRDSNNVQKILENNLNDIDYKNNPSITKKQIKDLLYLMVK